MSTGGSPMDTITVQLAELFQAPPLYSWVQKRGSYAIDLTFLMVVLLVVLRPYGNMSVWSKLCNLRSGSRIEFA